MEGSLFTPAFEAKIERIRFSLATHQEICKASISDCPISHASQLCNPFLGLPLDVGKCESCGAGEPGQCEGHFGYIELPTPIYHPDHVAELKRMLNLLCLKCLKLKNRRLPAKSGGIIERVLSACCEETTLISINEVKTTDGACYLELKVPGRSKPEDDRWNFLEKYGFRYGGHSRSRPLLPSEVMEMLRKLPQDTKKKLSAKGYFPQDGYLIKYLPVPPNCLSVPDISDGISTMSTDHSISLLKKVLRQVEIIKNSRSGKPNFASQEIEANDLQAAAVQYLQFRGTGKATRDVDNRFGVNKEVNASSTKAWLEKMKTLFIRKGSGFSSRSVITGDPFKEVSAIGLPFEIAQKITYEERVNDHNREFLQKLVDEKLCLTYKDGMSTYSLREGSKGHTFLKPGQVVHRRIMDGDIVFINRPPTTHKHSLQALSVYVHDDHTVKINPLICGPLSADFDGDCIHLFYPQSLEAKAEAMELFAVEKQLLSSHTGNFNLQLGTDSLLSLKLLFSKCLLRRAAAEQLAMFVPNVLSKPAVLKSDVGPLWTASQILEICLPPCFDSSGERHSISRSEVLRVDYSRDSMASIVNDLVTSLFFLKGPKEVLRFFNSIQPLLMESLYSQGFSVSLRDFFIPWDVDSTLEIRQKICTNFIQKSSAIGYLIDSKSESALNKVIQQIGYLGLQISDKGKFYTEALVKDMSSMFVKKYPCDNYPIEGFGLIDRPLFRGLDPYQEMVHSISSREVIVRSSRGLTEPGTLFKNLMAILRDVVMCQDGTVRNMCSNSIIQFEYGINSSNVASEFCAGDPVGVLAATAMSNPAYKAVLDSSPSSNNSWEMMKEILLSGVNFKNAVSDRRLILYLNSCNCGQKDCQDNAAVLVQNQLKKITLKDVTHEFLIEYRSPDSFDANPGLVGHIHLNKRQLQQLNISMDVILGKCEEKLSLHQKKKKKDGIFKGIFLSSSDCSFCLSSKSEGPDTPCIQFFWQGAIDDLSKRASQLVDTVSPVIFQTVIKGDPRVSSANKVWVSPQTENWIRSPYTSSKGEWVLDVILEKEAVKKSGDAWRIVMDSCIPVIHLIDTQRSVPYGIKEIQELLGISCTFEQAVQRLTTSVTMVTKGVLKDHLLLLGNNMTCTGTLIGFNAGGIKHLSKSLDVQVPFMSATLSTPRKCFERAAEKCHVDNLSSIVASCAWGKHVSVGTGSPFEILWDTKKAELNSEKEIDVYDFLRDMSCGLNLEGDTGCLGAEIEDLDQADEFMEFGLSPEREPGQDKPTFEDGPEIGVIDGWDTNGLSKEDAGWSSWGKKDDSQVDDWINKQEQSAWDKKANFEESDWGKKAEGSDWGKKSEENTWDKKVNSEEGDWGKKAEDNTWGKKVNSEESDWGKKVNSEGSDWGKKAEESTWGKKVNSEGSDWGKKVNSEGSDWGKKVNSEGSDWGKKAEESTWGKKVNSEGSDWGKKDEESTWGKKVNSEESERGKKGEESSWGKKVGSEKSDWGKKGEESSWGKKVTSEENDWTKTGGESSWGKKGSSEKNNWGDEDTWGKKGNSISKESSSWGEKSKSKENEWGVKNAVSEETKSSDENTWDKKKKWEGNASKEDAWGKKVSSEGGGGGPEWGKMAESDHGDDSGWGKNATSQENNSWMKKADSAADAAWGNKSASSTWGPKNDSDWGKKPEQQSTRKDASAAKTQDGDPWSATGTQNSLDASDNPWDSKLTTQATPSNTWGGSSNDWSKFDSQSSPGKNNKEFSSDGWGSSQKQSDDNQGDNDSRPQWGRGRGRGRGRGWGRGGGGRSRDGSQGRGDGERKPWRPRPTDDPSAAGLFSATKKRLDSFTAEEQDVLSETESIMKTIRRIMNQSGDGDPLSADDQNYIIENVLNYHSDKAVKIGAGIKHIMVTKHELFQDSRCFYVVTVDDTKNDFSYRKCLENLIREKFPDKAETFISKYFRRPQPRQGWTRDPSQNDAAKPGWQSDSAPTPNDGAKSGWQSDSAPTPNDGAKSGWQSDSAPTPTPTPGDSAKPGWQSDWAPTPNDAGTPSCPGPDDAGTPGWN
ncbi:DNA-directed RNA polymerase V subunit 1 [Andrographis paniculata]|uniref:DNA-directed RNA polymerase V subunit 1 n=1 Tax=Andrographis paniculata TaxID=175694 RepID=UPI0021E78D3A|nr:DNA-directed RNA polymerase V subunit 1 [Andrographis paniculata]